MRSMVMVLFVILAGMLGDQCTFLGMASASQGVGGDVVPMTEPADEWLSPRTILYVDDNASQDPGPNDLTISDPGENGSPDNPFDSIQEAIEVARDHVTIWVRSGRYRECVNFRGKALRVIGFDPNSDTTGQYPVIDANDQGTVVTFSQGEDASCLLSGFVLTGGYDDQAGAIKCHGSSPTIRHCLIVGNRCMDSGVGVPGVSEPNRAAIYCVNSQSLFENCTIADNYGGRHGSGISVTNGHVVLSNTILWGNAPEQIQVISGNGPTLLDSCRDIDPLFALPGYWMDASDPNLAAADPNDPKAIWLAGDYHLQSLHGRYDPYLRDWAYDDLTSDCIDLGDPNQSVGQETAPHGDRINAGAYGGTWMASRTGKLVFMTISEPDFTGQMSKYEITTGQYCQYLDMALAEGLIEVSNNRVYASWDTSHLELYFKPYAASSTSQISFSEGRFTVRSRDGYSMATHPVVEVSAYGAAAFADYFGYRLPTSEEWQAVADYDGTYTYACGEVIDLSLANYDAANPLGLTSFPYTSPVGYYPSCGYGLADMAGNVREWTDSVSGRYTLLKSGDWASADVFCTVWAKGGFTPGYTLSTIGFRVCR